MNSFIKRLLSGIVYVALLVSAIWFNPFYTFILFALFLGIGLNEYYTMMKVGKSFVFTGYLINIGLYMILGRLWFHSYILFLLIPICALFIQTLFDSQSERPFEKLGIVTLPIFYITIPLVLALRIPYVTDEGFRPDILIGVFVLIWSSDTFAYLVGSWLGKTKLFERISPNKTWEGSIGGALCTIGIGLLLQKIWPLAEFWHWPLLAVIVTIFGTLGDLVESTIKRNARVKDSGNIMPGHGGILDRLDSFIFAIPIVYLILSIL